MIELLEVRTISNKIEIETKITDNEHSRLAKQFDKVCLHLLRL
jgi:hypothetical protein